jgi:hypothetical protein
VTFRESHVLGKRMTGSCQRHFPVVPRYRTRGEPQPAGGKFHAAAAKSMRAAKSGEARAMLKKYEIPVTCENYIHLAFLGTLPMPGRLRS